MTDTGFWKRLGAYLIDQVITTIFVVPVYLVAMTLGSILVTNAEEIFDDKYQLLALMAMIYFVAWVFTVILQWIYYARFEASECKGTPGKWALKIEVQESLLEDAVSFQKASIRFFVKYFSIIKNPVSVLGLVFGPLFTLNPTAAVICEILAYMLGFLLVVAVIASVFCTQKHQAPHDLLAQTIVRPAENETVVARKQWFKKFTGKFFRGRDDTPNVHAA